MYHYLYKTTNLINNKIYIGMHSSKLLNDSYCGSGIAISGAVKKYGKDNFKKEILEYFPSRDLLDAAETAIVDQEFVDRKDTYNLIKGGRSYSGHNKETRAIIAQSSKGRKHTQETINKISVSKIGNKHTAEAKLKMSKSAIGNSNAKGYKHTDSAKAKMAGIKMKCPTCSKIGSGSVMKRWHFNNCRN